MPNILSINQRKPRLSKILVIYFNIRKLTAIPLLLYAIVVSGSNYYVKNGGDDSNTGLSDSQAWANHPWMSTWSGKPGVLKPGDIVYLKRGNKWIIANPLSPFITVNQSGSEGKYIATSAYGNGDDPLIKISTNSNYAVISIRGKSFIKFDHLHIQHWTSEYVDGGDQMDGIKFYEAETTPHDIIITNCEIHNIPRICINGHNNSYNIIIGDINATRTATSLNHSNHLYNFGYAGICLKGSDPANLRSNFDVYYNYIHDATRTNLNDIAYGIAFDASPASHSWPKYATAKYNRVENIKTWEGIECHGGSFIYFLDNYVKNFGTIGIWAGGTENIGYLPATSNNIYIERNIVEQPAFGWVIGHERAFILQQSESLITQPSDIFIRDNICHYTSTPTTAVFAGIRTSNVNRIIISGNKIYDGPPGGEPAIYIGTNITNGCKNVVVSDNFINHWGAGIKLIGSSITDSMVIKYNIVKSTAIACILISYSNIPSTAKVTIYNNTLVTENIDKCFETDYGISAGGSFVAKNNILGWRYYVGSHYYYWYWGGIISGIFNCDNNFYWNCSSSNPFYFNGIVRNWSNWTTTLGYDNNGFGPNSDPLFENSSGTYSEANDFILKSTSPAINKGTDVGLSKDYAGNPIAGIPDIGAFEYQPVQPPIFISATVENATPSRLGMTYSLNLANIVPSVSAFTVRVNSTARTVSSVAVSGTKVLLTLSSPVVHGDIVTVTYTKPSANPLQTPAGGQAASISAQNVTNKVAAPPVPVFQSAVIENATPSRLELTYNLSLANIVPAVSAFIVRVNSTARSINSVAISGTRVLLTLSSLVAYGDVVTVAYAKPSTNPVQTINGGEAASFSARNVTNNVTAPAVPVFVNAVIEDAIPLRIDITYNLALASIVPSVSAFAVKVNSIARTVLSVSISGPKVMLNLTSPVAHGDNVTVAYSKPAVNPLQTPNGGQAASFSTKTVTNRVAVVNIPPVIIITSPQTSFSGFINEIDAGRSYDANKDNLTYTWSTSDSIPLSSTTGAAIEFLGPIVSEPTIIEFTVDVSDSKATVTKVVPVEILPYKPDLEAAEILSVEASSFKSPNNPSYAIDGNMGTMWSANGTDQWLLVEIKDLFSVQHIKIAFQPDQKTESYFEVLGSNNKEVWEPVITKTSSCGFSGDMHIFDLPLSKAVGKEYRYIKLAGLGNSSDTWNHISELRIFGYKHPNPFFYEDMPAKLFPNPATNLLNIRIDEPELAPNFIRILNLAGETIAKSEVSPEIREHQIPLNLRSGIYIIQLGSDDITLFTQKLIISKN